MKIPRRLQRRIGRVTGIFNRRTVTKASAAIGVFGVLVSMAAVAWPAPGAQAAINSAINFQGKLVNANGTNIPNGTYNLEFKLYTAGTGCVGGGSSPCGGTLQWTEDWLRNNSQGVTVTDGIFQVNLGSITSLPAIFNNSTIWMSINLGNTNATCTPFSSCSGDGEMLPFVRFTASPYALNSDLLNGLNSSAFAQLSPGSAQSGFLNVTGNVTSGGTVAATTSLQAPLVDTASAVALNVGTGTASSLNIGRTTTPFLIQGNSSSTFTATSGANTTTVSFTAPTANRAINFPDAGGTLCTTTASTCSATYQVAGSYLAKNAVDTSSFAVTAANYLYGFTNSSSAVASGVLKLDNGSNTGSGLTVVGSGNPAAGQALILANGATGITGNLLDLQVNASSKFSVNQAGAVTSGTVNGQTISSAASFTGTVTAATSLLAPLVDTASAGTLSVGTGTATGLTLGKSSYQVSIPGGLTTNGSAIATANGNLTLGSGNITSTGTIGAGAITGTSLATSSNGTINSGSGTISTTGALNGGTATLASNGAAATPVFNFTGTPLGGVAAAATTSLVSFGGAIAGGNQASNGGTYLGLNLPAASNGSAADFLNFQKNGSVEFKVDNSGNGTLGGGLTVGTGSVAAFSTAGLLQNAAIDSTVTYSNLQKVGTISTGTWQGTAVGVLYGGTGQTSYTDGQLLIGNTTGNTLTKATLTGTANRLSITNGSGSITLNVDTTQFPNSAGANTILKSSGANAASWVANTQANVCSDCATTTLNNLGTTAVNAALLSASNNTVSIGSAANVWQNVFTGNIDAGTTTTALTVGTAATTTAITIGRSAVQVSIPGGLTTNGSAIATANGNLTLGSGTINTTGTITSGLINGQTISSTANFTGTLTAATSLQAPLVDTASAVALSVGTGTASSVTVGRANSGTNLTLQGSASTTWSATSASGATTVSFVSPTATNTIRFQNAGGDVCTTVASTCSATYQVASATGYLAKNATDTSSFAVTTANYLYGFTNSSSAVASGVLKLDNGSNTGSGLTVVGSGNPAAGQALILANGATGITGNLLDLQVNASSKFSVNQAGAVTTGSSINSQTISSAASFTGTVTAATSLIAPLVGTANGAGASTALVVQSGNTTGGSGLSTGTVTIKSGDGTGTSTSTGNVTIDSGAKSSGGFAGNVYLGNTNAPSVNIGRNSATATGTTVSIQGLAASSNLVFNDGTNTNQTTITIATPTAARSIIIPNAGGTLCLDSGNCDGTTGVGYILNQTGSNQTANFQITGSGRANTSILTPLLDTPSGTTTLAIGTTNATAGINLNQSTTILSGKSLTVAGGALTQSGGAVSLTANAASSFTTSSGALTLTAAAASLWGTSAGDLGVYANANLNLGNQGGTAINIGTNAAAHTIAVGTDSTNAQSITVGSTNSGSTVTSKAGALSETLSNTGDTIRTGTSSAGNTATALQIQNGQGAAVLGVGTNDTNLILNPGAEVAFGSEWAAYGTNTTVARNISNAWNGVASVSVVVTPSTASRGVQNNLGAALSTSTAYTVSFYAKLKTGDPAFADIAAAYSRDGTAGTETACSSYNTQTVVSGGWTRITCTFTSSGTAGNASAYIVIRQTAGAARTFYLDGVQLEQTSNIANAYGAGTLQVDTAVSSPIMLQNTENSTTALSVQNAAGTTQFVVDTLNSQATFSGQLNVGGTLQTNTITPTGTLTIGATGQQLTLQGNASTSLSATGGGFTTTLGFAGTPTGAVTYNLDRSATAGTYLICTELSGSCDSSTGYLRKGVEETDNVSVTTSGHSLLTLNNGGSGSTSVLTISNGSGLNSAFSVTSAANVNAGNATIFASNTLNNATGNLLDLQSTQSATLASRFAVDMNGNATQSGGTSTTDTLNGQRISSAANFTGTVTEAGALTVSAGGAGITGNSSVTGTLGVTSVLSVTGTGAAELIVSGAPAVSNASSLVQIGGAAISGGSVNGTYIGLNTSGATTADLLNLENNNTSEFKVTSAGVANATTGFSVGGTSGTSFGACGAGQYVASFQSSGGIVIGGSCTALPSTGGFLAKNQTSTETSSGGVAGDFYDFTNTNSTSSANVLTLTNSGTGNTLKVTSAANPAAGNALIFASDTNASPSGNLLDLQAGSSPTSRFAVDASGNLTLAGSIDSSAGINIGTGTATSVTLGKSTTTVKINGTAQIGNAAGSGALVNNGSTTNTVLAIGDTATGNIGASAAATVDIYTYISVAETTASQSLTLFSPSASTTYGKLLYLSNIGTAAFSILGSNLSPGSTATLIWANKSGGAAWTFAGADASGLQTAYNNSATTDPQIQLSNANGGIKIRDAASSTISNLLQIADSAGTTVYLGVTSAASTITGNLLFTKQANRTIQVNDSTTAATAGGNLTVQAAAGNTSGVGGNLVLNAGAGGNTAAGGAVQINGGAAGGGNTNGGAVTLTGGTAAGTGTGGLTTVQGGAASATAGSTGGGLTLAAANGSNTGTGGNGGSVSITAGNGLGSGGATNGGNITLQAGSAIGGGTVGVVNVQGAGNAVAAFTVKSSAAASLLSVDSTNGGNLTVLGNNSGETSAWATTNTLTLARDNAGVVTSQGYVYVIGGGATTSAANTTVYYAKINADGTTGTFASTTATPAAIRNAAVVAVGNYIYVIGGNNGGGTVSTQYVGKVNLDGTISSWTTLATGGFSARDDISAVYADGYLYVVGGSDGGSVLTTIQYAKVNADATLGTWTSTGGFNNNEVYGYGIATSNHMIYVVGGHGSGVSTVVQAATITPSTGALTTFTTTGMTALPAAREFLTAGIANGYLYAIGGNSTGGNTSQTTVYYAAISSTGTIGAWTTAGQAITSRARHGSFIANNNLYVVGGDNVGTVSTAVQYAPMPRLRIGGGLDLVGISAGNNLADGFAGGTLTAGNTNIVGTLTVQSAASFAQGFSAGALRSNDVGVFNGGSTVNGALALGNFAAGGAIGTAAATVDIYTTISIAQTTAGQTLTIPTPTSAASYGRLLYLTNIGTASFTLLTTTIGPGSTATLVWANTNGGASWTFAGADGSGILNQNSADQTANFRITGTGRANTSITTPLVDSITGGLNVGTTTATGVTIGSTTNTTAITLQGAAGATISLGGILTVNTSTKVIQIGSGTSNNGTSVFALNNNDGSTTPTEVDGGMYYNNSTSQFLCGENGFWVNCGVPPRDHSYDLYDEFMSGNSGSLVTGAYGIGGLNWYNSLISAPGALTYNNNAVGGNAPAASADRPGIIDIQQTGTGNNTGQTMSLGLGSTLLGTSRIDLKTAVNVTGSNLTVLIGLHNETTAITAPTTGIYWKEAGNGLWQYCYANATPAETCANSAVTATAGTWARLEIVVVSSTEIDYYINGTKIAATGITYNTTNKVAPAYTSWKSTGTPGTLDVYVDYFELLGTTSTAR